MYSFTYICNNKEKGGHESEEFGAVVYKKGLEGIEGEENNVVLFSLN